MPRTETTQTEIRSINRPHLVLVQGEMVSAPTIHRTSRKLAVKVAAGLLGLTGLAVTAGVFHVGAITPTPNQPTAQLMSARLNVASTSQTAMGMLAPIGIIDGNTSSTSSSASFPAVTTVQSTSGMNHGLLSPLGTTQGH